MLFYHFGFKKKKKDLFILERESACEHTNGEGQREREKKSSRLPAPHPPHPARSLKWGHSTSRPWRS